MKIYKDKILFSTYLASAILLVIGFSLIYVGLFDVKSLLVIHLNPFSGIDFLGVRLDAYGILLVGIVLNLFNGFLSVALYDRDKFLSRLIGFSTTFLSLLILLVISVIVAAN